MLHEVEEMENALRTAPAKYRGMMPESGLCGKGLLESKKKTRGRHAFFRDN